MRRSLAILLVAQVALGVVYSFVFPIFEVSDEVWHYPVVRELVEGRGLPVQDPGTRTRWQQEGSQPPLYYLIGAALTSWIDISDYEEQAVRNPFVRAGIPGTAHNVNMVAHPPGQSPWQGGTVLAVYMIRWLSILMGTVTAYLTYRLVSEIYPARPPLALLATGLVAFNPMVLMINGSVNNDNLLMLLTSLALLLLVRDVRLPELGPRWQSTLALGMIVGLAVLTKVSALVLLPISALAVTLSAWQVRDWRSWWARGATLLVLVLMISGWWFVRNYFIYGEFLGIERMVAIAGPRPVGFTLYDLRQEWDSFWYSFWGVFGAFNVLASAWFYQLLGAFSLVSGAGLLVRLVPRCRSRLSARDWAPHLLLISIILITFVSLVRWTLQTPASQGRLMFAAIAPIGMYLGLGILTWLPRRWHSGASYLLPAGLAAIALVVVITDIAPAYRPPAPVKAVPDQAVPLDVRFGETVRLVGYRMKNQYHEAGEPLEVAFYWTTDRPIEDRLNLSVEGLGYDLEPVLTLNSWPGGGLLPTDQWEPGKIYLDAYRLATSPDADTPTELKLNLFIWRQRLSNRLPIVADNKPVRSVMLSAGGLVSPLPQAPESERIVSTFQQGIILADYELAQREDSLELLLEWTTMKPVPKDYTVFAHLYDSEGNVVEQVKKDGPPRQGYWPTSKWRVGEIVRDTHTLPLPPDLPAGEYTVRIGLYDPATVTRLFAFLPNGQEWRDRLVVLKPPVILKD